MKTKNTCRNACKRVLAVLTVLTMSLSMLQSTAFASGNPDGGEPATDVNLAGLDENPSTPGDADAGTLGEGTEPAEDETTQVIDLTQALSELKKKAAELVEAGGKSAPSDVPDVTIPEEVVPLGDPKLPKTGGFSSIWYTMTFLAAAWLVFVSILIRKKQEESQEQPKKP